MRRFLCALGLLAALTASPALALTPVGVMGALMPPVGPVTAGGFTPTTLGAAVGGFWDADDLGAGAVATWTDRKNSVATTATSTAQPTAATTSWTGTLGPAKAAITCDGVANALVNTSFAALPSGGTAGEVWALVNQTAGADATTRRIIQYGGTTSATGRVLQRVINGNSVWRTGDGSTANADDQLSVASGPHVVNGNWNGTLMGVGADGLPYPTMAVTATLATSTTRLRICSGNATSAGNFWQGTVRHILVTTLLTNTQRLQLGAWLAWDGGITYAMPYSHPYRLRRP